VPADTHATWETSVRTALTAVWGLTGLQKPMIPVYEPAFDLRVLVANLKASLGIKGFCLSRIPHLIQSAPSVRLTARYLSRFPELPI